MNDDVVFADRFRFPFTMFGNHVLIVLSRLHDADVGHEIDTYEINATFCRISYRLYDLIRLNTIACRVQTT